MDDAAFRRGIRDRSPEAWERLAEAYHATLRRQASLILPPHLDPENAVGEVWLRALEAAPSYDPERHPFPWLSRICVRTCLNQHRSLGRAFLRLARLRMARAHEDPVKDKEAREGLRNALMNLPRHERDVISLRFLFELPIDEIAVLLSRTPSTIRSTLVRGFARLRSHAKGGAFEAWTLADGKLGERL